MEGDMEAGEGEGETRIDTKLVNCWLSPQKGGYYNLLRYQLSR
jgi:hypothetical protein